MAPIGPDDAALHPGQIGQASPLLFTGLIDDAAMFPPGNAPLERALTEHARHRTAWYADLVGPLLVPADRVPELIDLVAGQPNSHPPAIGVIATGGVEPAAAALTTVATSAGVEAVAVELSLAHAGDLTDEWVRLSAGGLAVWWEIDRSHDVRAHLDRLAAAGRAVGAARGGAKLRLGGVTPGAWPSETDVAAFLRHAIDVDLTFKLTAGLHHAVRTTDPATGLEQHGVLNVLCAVKAALNGAEIPELAELLGERDPAPLVERTNGMSEADASVARAFWSSFGCCGVTDPIGELAALALLSPTAGASR